MRVSKNQNVCTFIPGIIFQRFNALCRITMYGATHIPMYQQDMISVQIKKQFAGISKSVVAISCNNSELLVCVPKYSADLILHVSCMYHHFKGFFLFDNLFHQILSSMCITENHNFHIKLSQICKQISYTYKTYHIYVYFYTYMKLALS